MRLFVGLALCAGLICASAPAQSHVVNGGFSALNLNGPAAAVVGLPGPVTICTTTDSIVNVEIKGGFGTNPVVLFFSGATTPGPAVINPGAVNISGVQFDLTDLNGNGYNDQIVFNGLANPSPLTYTQSTGILNVNLSFPACTINASNQMVCITAPTFDIALQAVVMDSSAPMGVSTTGTGLVNFINGYQSFTTTFVGGGSDQFGTFTFKKGMTFPMYGVTYTQAHVSENAMVQFGTTTNITQFPSPTVSQVNNGGRRIMSFYTDLDPDGGQSPMVYAQQFEENGIKKVRFIHKGIAEFGNATGPHGGTITITELGEIGIYVISQSQPSIDTAVGITAGTPAGTNGAAGGVTFNGTYGVDLSAARAATASGNIQTTGVMGNCFEIFDHGPPSGAVNPIDLIGAYFSNGTTIAPGLLFLPDISLASPTTNYIIQ